MRQYVTLQTALTGESSVTMNILISTLNEELSTIKRLEQKYLKKIAALPKGSFIVRRVRNKKYGYLTYRENNKVKQKYLGPMTEDQISTYKNHTKQKKEYKKKLKSIREQKKIIERALRGKAK